MAMLAAIAGISPWERHSNLTDKFLIDDDGGIVMRHTIRTMVYAAPPMLLALLAQHAATKRAMTPPLRAGESRDGVRRVCAAGRHRLHAPRSGAPDSMNGLYLMPHHPKRRHVHPPRARTQHRLRLVRHTEHLQPSVAVQGASVLARPAATLLGAYVTTRAHCGAEGI